MHPWLAPIAASAALLGLYDICRKHAVHANAVAEVLFISSASGAAAYAVALALSGRLAAAATCSAGVLGLVAAKALLVGASWACVYRAMCTMPISLAAPIRATSPLWTVFGAMLLFGELPGAVRASGMALVFAGYFRFSALGGREGFSMRHRDMHLLVLGTLLGSASALYDKYLLNVVRIPPQTVQLFFSLFLVAIYAAAWAALRGRNGGEGRAFRWRWSIPATGILLIASDFLYFHALSLPEVHISVLSLIRRCSCLMPFAAGAWLFGNVNLRPKTLALLAILAGVAVIALS